MRPARVRVTLRGLILAIAGLALACGLVVHHEVAWCRYFRALADEQAYRAEACAEGEECNDFHALHAERARSRSRPWSTPRPWRWPSRVERIKPPPGWKPSAQLPTGTGPITDGSGPAAPGRRAP